FLIPSSMDSAWTALDVVTQTMFQKAIADPKSVDLEKLPNAVVVQSLKDISFCKDAGCLCYAVVQVNNAPLVALVDPVYDCLYRLAQPDALMNEEEVDCLVVQLHRVGKQMEQTNSQRMNQLFYLLRDGFLLTRLLLLEILEFRASGWTTTLQVLLSTTTVK
uniref:MIF4G domain containing a n=1 Tax=Sinocyclocheilus anshuiensis TaxID=1608454 RepID=A0A671K4Z2_9TELE